jgi:Diiron non-heme beta-hydroxylase N-terminal domain
MARNDAYLKPNILAVRLFNQRYAWPYLINPEKTAMFLANHHLKIMQSFVSALKVHAAALNNSVVLCGPFINYEASRGKEIKAYYGWNVMARRRAGYMARC